MTFLVEYIVRQRAPDKALPVIRGNEVVFSRILLGINYLATYKI